MRKLLEINRHAGGISAEAAAPGTSGGRARASKAYEVLAGNTSDKTTLRDFLKKIEAQYGKVERIWVMDRGIPTEEVPAEMRPADPPISYLVGTPKGRLSKLEAELCELPWEQVREGVEIKLLPREGELYVFAKSCDRVHVELDILLGHYFLRDAMDDFGLEIELLLESNERNHDFGLHLDLHFRYVRSGFEDGAGLHLGDLRIGGAEPAAAMDLRNCRKPCASVVLQPSMPSLTFRHKRHGVYYTPQHLSEVLTTWSVRSRAETVFEPGFGECVFLEAIADRLCKLRASQPHSLVFGCDIQKKALRSVPTNLRGPTWQEQFLHSDFLKLLPASFGVHGFDVILGNPPYVSRHNMFLAQRSAAEKVATLENYRLPLTSSLWAFFVLHAVRFLNAGGRMAWVLPASALTAAYARGLFAELCGRFERVTVISMRERLFLDAGAEESSELLLCENHRSSRRAGGVEYHDFPDTASCGAFLGIAPRAAEKAYALSTTEPSLTCRLSSEEHSAWREWNDCEAVTRLGTIAQIRIGMVTGANHFFVLNRSAAIAHKLPADALKPIFAKISAARGLALTGDDLKHADNEDARCLLLHPDCEPCDYDALVAYYAQWREEELEANVTFAKRECWWRPDDGQTPAAFLSYMNHEGPRLVLNVAAVNSTNTIHRVDFHPKTSAAARKGACLSLLSSFSQLGAELHGRVYGGGLLKHEPSDARALPLVTMSGLSSREMTQLFKKADRLWREGEREKVQALIDAMIAEAVGGHMAAQLPGLRAALARMRARRWRGKDHNPKR